MPTTESPAAANPASSPTPHVSGCIILAAGGSRRLGHPKQLVRHGGHTLIEQVVDSALAVGELWPVVVVVGGAADEIRPLLVRRPVLVADNPAWEEGVASSVRVGLDTLEKFSRDIDSVLLTLCDQPGLNTNAYRALLAARQRSDRPVVAAHYGGHPGAPALIHRSYFAELARLTGDAGARQLFPRIPEADREWVDLPELAHDIDTPEDLARLRDQE